MTTYPLIKVRRCPPPSFACGPHPWDWNGLAGGVEVYFQAGCLDSQTEFTRFLADSTPQRQRFSLADAGGGEVGSPDVALAQWETGRHTVVVLRERPCAHGLAPL